MMAIAVADQLAGKEIIFQPIKGSSQEFAIDSRAYETLYFGTRGPGKTATQLNFFRKYVGIGYGKFLKGIIFDRQYKSFNDIISQAKRFFLPYGDCVFKSSAIDLKFVWNTGEELLFRHIDKLDQYDSLHGSEFCILMFNELTKYADSKIYDKLLSLNRSSFVPSMHTPRDASGCYLTHDGKPLPEIPLKVFSTCNPSGPGRLWVKKRFIDCGLVGKMIRKPHKIFNPRKQKEEVIEKTQIAIFGSYRENIYLTPEYIASLEEAVANNPHLRKAWLEGSWDGSSDGVFDDIFNRAVHVIPRFRIPENWKKKRCFDWGSSAPFGVVWIATATGEEVVFEYNGETRRFSPRRGSAIVYNEWYGGVDISTNEGLKMSASEIAKGILDIERFMISSGAVTAMAEPGAADNQIAQTREADVDSIKKKMEAYGVKWNESDKSKGSRVNGLQIMREMFKASLRGEGAGLYFMENCVNCIATIPSLPRDDAHPEDSDSDANDHLYDALRYGVLEMRQSIAYDLKVKMYN